MVVVAVYVGWDLANRIAFLLSKLCVDLLFLPKYRNFVNKTYFLPDWFRNQWLILLSHIQIETCLDLQVQIRKPDAWLKLAKIVLAKVMLDGSNLVHIKNTYLFKFFNENFMKLLNTASKKNSFNFVNWW